MTCPCGSGDPYESCCGVYHRGDAWPETAEKLMRSRYSAFVKKEIDYIHDTLEPSTREEADPEATKKWAESAEWEGFEIVQVTDGGEDDTTGTVEFIARYSIGGIEQKHHEVSSFTKTDGKWYFLDGQVQGQTFERDAPKVGRNDPCPCGSGKKYKKCHAAS